MKKFLYNRNPLNILSYLGKNRFDDFLYGAKIADDIGINQGGTSIILKEFHKMGIIQKHGVGKTLVYSVNKKHPVLKMFRVFENIVEINGLVENIKEQCKKIILFGSCSTGDDTAESDIDLFVLTIEDAGNIRKKILKYKTERQIKSIVINQLELIEMEKKDKVFMDEVKKGLILWGE